MRTYYIYYNYTSQRAIARSKLPLGEDCETVRATSIAEAYNMSRERFRDDIDHAILINSGMHPHTAAKIIGREP